MRSKFSWYFAPSKCEIEKAWKSGVLSVDTNVLLDLYRYHKETRDSLLASIRGFEGSKWLSYQAATEFFRNRTKVIVSSEKSFKNAEEEVSKLSASLEGVASQLRGNRIIPAEIARELAESIAPALTKAKDKIAVAKSEYPKFLQDDPILKELAEIFDGAVGDDFPEDQRESIRATAEERKEKRIPPGYADDEKDEDRSYGDYYLWKQILDHAAQAKRSVVLVTSERKEDWWERISGRTTGPRPELLREALAACGQRIHIYQTEQFLEYSLQRAQKPINENAIEEIRAVSRWRAELEAAVVLQKQDAKDRTSLGNAGRLFVALRRPVRNFTVSGHLAPNMVEVPQLNARLVSGPSTLPDYSLNVGTGTTYDFNIHIISKQLGVRLPVGDYVFEYEAKCEPPEEQEQGGAEEI
ncbi:PIN-like domain-containing protein [uncultured Aquimonas sp.]|uniref:PIN-like domain-containing protein n=1 Tax=uncultured Aquimonas sp. TaxID=385483 RepID=UPI000AEE257F|nr:PIN-like domain-containing protein [uncultured Aquimonas sp.]